MIVLIVYFWYTSDRKEDYVYVGGDEEQTLIVSQILIRSSFVTKGSDPKICNNQGDLDGTG